MGRGLVRGRDRGLVVAVSVVVVTLGLWLAVLLRTGLAGMLGIGLAGAGLGVYSSLLGGGGWREAGVALVMLGVGGLI